jgi:D-glycero-D-manno-heptose 1,7-bisphosphate phosphatase
MNAARRAAAFLDRDGVVVEEVGHLSCAADVRLTAGAAAAIRRLNERDVPVVAVTNQAGVARTRAISARAIRR